MINHKQSETLKEKSVTVAEDLTLWEECSGEKPLSAHVNTFHFSNQNRATEIQTALFNKLIECVQVCSHIWLSR